jgi:hypothetical protein
VISAPDSKRQGAGRGRGGRIDAAARGDFNAGAMLDGEARVSELGQALFEDVPAMASGRRTRSEEFGFGEKVVRAVAARGGDVIASTPQQAAKPGRPST